MLSGIAVAGLHPAVVYGFVLAFGLCIGSFLNVLILRLPRMLDRQWRTDALEYLELPADPPTEPFDLARPRSRCPQCGHAISAIENIPVLSWLALRGRCRGCANPIPVRYPAVELAAAVLGLLAFGRFGLDAGGAWAALLVWMLLALAVIDLDTQLLPDDLTLPLLWAGLAANLSGTFAPLQDAVIGAMAGYLALWSVYHAFRLLTGREGMGYGDFKLLAAIGAWLGWQMLPVVVIASSALGAVVGAGLIVARRHQAGVPLPFGPFLAGAGVLALFWGPALTDLWLRRMS